ncbi:MAG: HAD family phosphatase [Candidatus Nanopusillus acidilobi]|nr:HAD family phosphatase [Candidatus Nanopusillus sp.]MCG2868676.1 HAD family phosphatase [Candidatus Nanopusillus sp.]MCG2882982.1 HAD family phosphatase [Candidatus Nanopusillus sp.]
MVIFYNLKGVIIDLDGTLINSLKVYDEVHKKILERYNVKIEGPLDNYGMPIEDIIYNIIRKYNLNISIEDIRKEFENMLINEYMEKIKFNPGAKQILNYFKDKKYKMAIFTSNTRRLTIELLKHLHVDNLFDVIITSDDVKQPKPDPEGYIKIVKEFSLLPNEILAIEDSIYGIIAAKRAGINVIGVASGVNKKRELISAGATMVFKNLKELYDYLVEEDNKNNQNNNQ